MAPPGLFRVGRIVPIVTSGISVPSSIRRYQMRLKEHCVANVANFSASEVLRPAFCYLAVRERWATGSADPLKSH